MTGGGNLLSIEEEVLQKLITARIRTRPASDLLFAKTKREVETKIAELVLTKENFLDLIESSELLGFQYEKRTYVHMMAEKPKAKEQNEHDRVLRDIRYLESRKNVIVHTFRNAEVWNIFYFTYSDVQNSNAHFKGGSHIHFVSNLWGRNVTLDAVLVELEERSFSVNGSHIATDFDE